MTEPTVRLSKDGVKKLQRDLNAFTYRTLENIGRLRVDGDYGPATRKRVRFVKYYLGWNKRDGRITHSFLRELHHPFWKSLFKSVNQYRRGRKRRRHQRKHMRELMKRAARSGDLVKMDGKYVVQWIAHRVQWARDHGWQGWVVSGYRTPEYSEHLCYAMCGRPSCPGKCAGRNTNHARKGFPEGAADVSHYYEFGEKMKQYEREHPNEPRLFNALGVRDPVHFSNSGR